MIFTGNDSSRKPKRNEKVTHLLEKSWAPTLASFLHARCASASHLRTQPETHPGRQGALAISWAASGGAHSQGFLSQTASRVTARKKRTVQ